MAVDNFETTKLTIALVANSTWNIYNFRQNIIRKLLQEGHKVIVIAPIDEYIEYKENYPEVIHVGLKSLKRNSTNPLRDLLLAFELKKKYAKLKPNIIIHYTHKPNIFGAIAAKINGIDSVAIITGLGYAFIRKGLINKITKQLYRLTSKYNKCIIFENQDDKQLFVDEKLVKPQKAFAIKGCGVDLEKYTPSINGIDHNNIVFTFIGRLLSDKGIREFAMAARTLKEQHKNLKFVVIGDFDEKNPSTIDRDELLFWINNKVIDYKGFVRNVRPFIAASDCIILPSYREGLPRIVIEAMAMAKPIITTDVPGCRETIDDNISGFLVKPSSIESLVRGVEKFLALNDKEKMRMGQAALKKAIDEFDDKKIADELYEIILRNVV